jgi:hypothetical protein
MLDENSVYYTDDVNKYPGAILEAREPAVHHHIFARRCDRSVLVLERAGKRCDQIAQAITAGRNVRAVLEIVRRPITIERDGVPPIERSFECSTTSALFFSSME